MGDSQQTNTGLRGSLIRRQGSGNKQHIENLAPFMGASRKFEVRKGTLTRKPRRTGSKNSQNSSGSLRSNRTNSRNDSRNDSAPSLERLSFRMGSKEKDFLESRKHGSVSFKEKVLEDLNQSYDFEEEGEGDHMPLFHESGYPLATRSLLEKDVKITDMAINLSGGIQIRYQSIASVRLPDKKGKNSTISFNKSMKRMKFLKRIIVIGKGNFRIYQYPRNGSGINTGTNMLTDSDLEELKLIESFSVSNLRAIRYNRRANKIFSLVYWKRLDEPTREGVGHVERTMHLKFNDGVESEDWIKFLLVEARNQALVFDSYAKVLRSERKNNDAVIAFLRLSVDLWSLSQGKAHPNTQDAQLRLADWLIAHNFDEEGKFWEHYATRRHDRNVRLSPLGELKAEIEDEKVIEELEKKMEETGWAL